MPRPLRSLIVEPGAPHHVILRGNNRRTLYSRSDSYCEFLRYFGDASARYAVPIHALALMTNHVHLVVTPPDVGALGAFVKVGSQRYAAYRNRERDGSGKLFEQRYTSLRIRDSGQLAKTVAYVDLNPVRAGMVAAPGDYTWSSYRSHAGAENAHPAITAVWAPHDWFLGLSPDPQRRAAIYEEWVADRFARTEELELIAAETRDRDDERARYGRHAERPDRSRVAEVIDASYGEVRTRRQNGSEYVRLRTR